MEKNQAIQPNIQDSRKDLGLDDDQDEIYKLLTDHSPLLGKMYYSIIHVLKDTENPDRFNQAANSIRGITDILSRNAKIQEKKPQTLESEDHIDKMNNIFKTALANMPVSTNKDDKCSEHDFVKTKYDDLMDILQNGASAFKQKLRYYFVGDDEIKRMSEELRNDVEKILSQAKKIHKFFTNLAHYGNGTFSEETFMDNFQFIQTFWRRALTPSYEDISAIDRILKLENNDDKQ